MRQSQWSWLVSSILDNICIHIRWFSRHTVTLCRTATRHCHMVHSWHIYISWNIPLHPVDKWNSMGYSPINVSFFYHTVVDMIIDDTQNIVVKTIRRMMKQPWWKISHDGLFREKVFKLALYKSRNSNALVLFSTDQSILYHITFRTK